MCLDQVQYHIFPWMPFSLFILVFICLSIPLIGDFLFSTTRLKTTSLQIFLTLNLCHIYTVSLNVVLVVFVILLITIPINFNHIISRGGVDRKSPLICFYALYRKVQLNWWERWLIGSETTLPYHSTHWNKGLPLPVCTLSHWKRGFALLVCEV